MFHVKQAVSVSRETQNRLRDFIALLLAWNRRINLISRDDEAAIWPRHVEDSLQLTPFLSPDSTRALDLGSGGGFPGIVLAIATGTHFTLVEADARKCAFLREAARLTAAPVEVINARIEDIQLPPFPLITARALAPLPRLLTLAAPLLEKSGTMLFPKGATIDAEITEAQNDWQMRIERHASQTGNGVILRITEVSRA